MRGLQTGGVRRQSGAGLGHLDVHGLRVRDRQDQLRDGVASAEGHHRDLPGTEVDRHDLEHLVLDHHGLADSQGRVAVQDLARLLGDLGAEELADLATGDRDRVEVDAEVHGEPGLSVRRGLVLPHLDDHQDELSRRGLRAEVDAQGLGEVTDPVVSGDVVVHRTCLSRVWSGVFPRFCDFTIFT